MPRLTRTISTIAVIVATAALIAPAAQARPVGVTTHGTPKLTVTRIVDYAYPRGDRGAFAHDTPLANPVQQPVTVTGRTVSTDGGIDWTFPVMGAIAIVLIAMILGEQVLGRGGRLAT